ALDCAGHARVDFFVTQDLEIYINEINTMPGFTQTSMFPQMWAATGLEYPKLLARLIRTALRRGAGLH
ncbi:MAG: D-alanine--D-alanine ligase A, partial [Micromonosporaceae bacterium]